jgi:hypothetical protein
LAKAGPIHQGIVFRSSYPLGKAVAEPYYHWVLQEDVYVSTFYADEQQAEVSMGEPRRQWQKHLKHTRWNTLGGKTLQ